MSYGGPFDSNYRNKLIESWKKELNNLNVPITNDVSLISVAGNKVLIEQWKAKYSLPDDSLSIENAIMIK